MAREYQTRINSALPEIQLSIVSCSSYPSSVLRQPPCLSPLQMLALSIACLDHPCPIQAKPIWSSGERSRAAATRT
eukprot:scaffold940_cov569-Prasinococcus_capsulatus_cf.AAC.6